MKFKKPVTKFSDQPKWKIYVVSISLQIYAWVLSKIQRREITHAFYYSERQANLPYVNVNGPTFKGEKYSEMRGLEYGWSTYPDAKLIGFGSSDDVKFNRNKYQFNRY